MIHTQNLSHHFGGDPLYENVSIQLNKGNRYGLVGANGTGKSTFLKIIEGTVSPQSGEVSEPVSLRKGILKQDHYKYDDNRILDVVLKGNTKLWSALEKKEELLQLEDLDEKAGEELAYCELAIADEDGYTAEANAGDLLVGLGIPTEKHENKLSSLSGGYKIRVLLAQCLFSNPDILVLDEPTNHLDIVSIAWLENYLIEEFKGTVLIASHDHIFLNRYATHILDVDYQTIKIYKGNYDSFLAQKKLAEEQLVAEAEKQEKKKEELEEFITKFKAKATKARQASSKAKQIDRMEDIVIKRTSRKSPLFQFKQVRPSGKKVLDVQQVHKSFGNNKVLNGVDFSIFKGEKVALIGPNGVGKSTLLKIILSELKQDSGDAEFGHEVYTSYFPQNHKDLLKGNTTIYEWLYSHFQSETIGAIRGYLGKMLFSQDDVHKQLQALSGGEASRLIMAKIMMENANFILLDEPTNHLDLEAIDALQNSLKEFEGTLLFVSHDRYFVDQVATKVIEIKEDQVTIFEGTYHEYLEKQGIDYLHRELEKNRDLSAKSSEKKEEKKAPELPVKKEKKLSFEDRKRLNRLKSQLGKLEDKISKKESKIQEIDNQLSDSNLYLQENKEQLKQANADKQELEEDLMDLMQQWEEMTGDIEELSS